MPAFFAFIYILSFLITPYWLLPQSTTKMVFFLGLIIVIGIVWIYVSTNFLEIQFNFRNLLVGCMIVLGIIVLNYRPLNSVIPFKGDEGFHIDRTLVLVTSIPLTWSIGVLLFFVLLMVSAIKKTEMDTFHRYIYGCKCGLVFLKPESLR